MYEKLYNNAKSNNLNIIECARYNFKENSGTKQGKHAKYVPCYNQVYNILHNPKSIFEGYLFPCNKLLKTSFIKENNIMFDKGRYGEDQIFTITAKVLAEKCLYIPEFLYNYRLRHDSTSHSQHPDRLMRVMQLQKLKDFLLAQNLDDNFYKFFEKQSIDSLALTYIDIPEKDKKFFDEDVKQYLSNESYKIFKKKAKKYKNIFELIFSVKNFNSTKVLTILGFKFKLKDIA